MRIRLSRQQPEDRGGDVAGQAGTDRAVMAQQPVRVNAVSPGVIDTGWWDFLDPEARRETFAGFAARTPVGRIGTPDDVADAIEYLVGNSFTSGVVLRVDGGARLGSTA
jgi:NAD(P)-dependent dehydrogenase (short-subunit alcohol dehydrogenase family)